MKVLKWVIFASIRAENQFENLLDRLFEPESLSKFTVNYSSSYDVENGAYIEVRKLNSSHNDMIVQVYTVYFLLAASAFDKN